MDVLSKFIQLSMDIEQSVTQNNSSCNFLCSMSNYRPLVWTPLMTQMKACILFYVVQHYIKSFKTTDEYISILDRIDIESKLQTLFSPISKSGLLNK